MTKIGICDLKKECPECGTNLPNHPYWYWSKRIYCSRSCNISHRNRILSKEKRAQIAKKIVEHRVKSGKWHPPGTKHFGDKNPAKRLDVRAKISEKMRGKPHPWALGENNPAKRTDVRAKLVAKRVLQKIPFIDTKIELIMQEQLLKNGIQFLCHVPIERFQTDIVLADVKIAIFCDGCYWHGCNSCSKAKYNQAYRSRNKRDAEITKHLENRGWKVLRFWEHEILASPEQCSNRVLELFNVIHSQIFGEVYAR